MSMQCSSALELKDAEVLEADYRLADADRLTNNSTQFPA
jgi:hypothetical protein